MISLLAQSFVIVGALILMLALLPVQHLVEMLPSGKMRSRWYMMSALIVLFLLGYLGYAYVFWDRHSNLLDLIVPGVFFFGACFVWLTTNLSLQTTQDIIRVSTLERETMTDSLTGIHNRRYLDQRLNEEVSSALRYGLPLSVLMLDIDHFKHVNDTYGHQAGDQVLAALSTIVAREIRETDVLARYGGEEFLVITPNTALSGAIDIAERLRKGIEANDFSISNARHEMHAIRVTISIGVSDLCGATDNKEVLVSAADENLYHAKHAGRNRVFSLKSLATELTEQE